MNNELMEGVGKRRVKIVDEVTNEVLASGVLQGVHYEVGADRLSNLSEARVAIDIPEHKDDDPT